mmetsp:Transcript_46455/g.91681  ORF Transcript_46455/g.91681 Transcript_46455/m.91681 type:complete len:83 (+) Transcript_46455:878-1126(+)
MGAQADMRVRQHVKTKKQTIHSSTLRRSVGAVGSSFPSFYLLTDLSFSCLRFNSIGQRYKERERQRERIKKRMNSAAVLRPN